MHIQIDNLKPISIPPFEPLDKAHFDHATSYLNRLKHRLKSKRYREILLPLKLQCLKTLANRIRPTLGEIPMVYCETMAGVGLTARLFEPFCERLYLNEIDPRCQKVLAYNFKDCLLSEQDAYSKDEWRILFSDIIFADYNNFTLRKFLSGELRPSVDALFFSSKRYVIINDCSLYYFRYGKKSYEVYSGLLGEEIHSKQDYFQALRAFYFRHYSEWELVEVQYFSETSFLLFEKTNQPRGFHSHEVQKDEGLKVTIL